MHNPTDRIAHITAFVTPVVEHWLERDAHKGVNSETFDDILYFDVS